MRQLQSYIIDLYQQMTKIIIERKHLTTLKNIPSSAEDVNNKISGIHCEALITIDEGRRFAGKVVYSSETYTSEAVLAQENLCLQMDPYRLNTELYKLTPF